MVLKAFYTNTSEKIKGYNYSVVFQPICGIRVGCLVSSFFFYLSIAVLLKTALKDGVSGGINAFKHRLY